MRTINNERMDVSGIAEAERICGTAKDLYQLVQSINDYKDYADDLETKIISARKGLYRLSNTYRSITGKTSIADKINTSCISVLDKLLSEDVKLEHGFIVKMKKKVKTSDGFNTNRNKKLWKDRFRAFLLQT